MGGEVGPDAVGQKQLRRGDLVVPVNLTCNSRPERATKAAKCGNRTCKAAAESAASQNGCELRSAVGRALGSQLTCPPLLTKTNCDDLRISASVFRAGACFSGIGSNYELN